MSLPLPAALTPPTTPRTAEAVAEVMDLAAEHAALNPVKAKMLRHEVRLLTTGKQRWMATVAHPADSALLRLVDALVADQPGWQTTHGFLTPDVLHEVEGRVDTAGGERVIRFPEDYPWSVPPDDKGRGGIRGEPVYRAMPTRETEQPEREKDWWAE